MWSWSEDYYPADLRRLLRDNRQIQKNSEFYSRKYYLIFVVSKFVYSAFVMCKYKKATCLTPFFHSNSKERYTLFGFCFMPCPNVVFVIKYTLLKICL